MPKIWVDIHERGGMFLDHGEGGGSVGYRISIEKGSTTEVLWLNRLDHLPSDMFS